MYERSSVDTRQNIHYRQGTLKHILHGRVGLYMNVFAMYMFSLIDNPDKQSSYDFSDALVRKGPFDWGSHLNWHETFQTVKLMELGSGKDLSQIRASSVCGMSQRHGLSTG